MWSRELCKECVMLMQIPTHEYEININDAVNTLYIQAVLSLM